MADSWFVLEVSRSKGTIMCDSCAGALVEAWKARLASSCVLRQLEPTPRLCHLHQAHSNRNTDFHASSSTLDSFCSTNTPDLKMRNPKHENIPELYFAALTFHRLCKQRKWIYRRG